MRAILVVAIFGDWLAWWRVDQSAVLLLWRLLAPGTIRFAPV